MKLSLTKIAIVILIAFLFAGCATSQINQNDSLSTAQDTSNELRVGVSPDYPPVIFRQNDNIRGIEADLAQKLGEELNLPVRFVALPWKEQIPALMDGRIDIIMSGMSVTKAREVRIVFTEPYLKSGLVAAFRAEDAKKYTSKDSILNAFITVGAVKETTGDAFVIKNFPNAVRKASFSRAGDGISELKRRAIDIFVNDAPYIIWTVSENETDIAALWEPLTEEYLAWGVRKEDGKFLMDVNSILGRWKQNGTLHEVLRQWLPEGYFKRINQ
jgi:polar amino acid transport system substrate-binding protein